MMVQTSSSSPDPSPITPTRTTRSSSRLLQRNVQEPCADLKLGRQTQSPTSSNARVDSPGGDEQGDNQADDPSVSGGSEDEDRGNGVVDEPEDSNSPPADEPRTPPISSDSPSQLPVSPKPDLALLGSIDRSGSHSSSSPRGTEATVPAPTQISASSQQNRSQSQELELDLSKGAGERLLWALVSALACSALTLVRIEMYLGVPASSASIVKNAGETSGDSVQQGPQSSETSLPAPNDTPTDEAFSHSSWASASNSEYPPQPYSQPSAESGTAVEVSPSTSAAKSPVSPSSPTGHSHPTKEMELFANHHSDPSHFGATQSSAVFGLKNTLDTILPLSPTVRSLPAPAIESSSEDTGRPSTSGSDSIIIHSAPPPLPLAGSTSASADVPSSSLPSSQTHPEHYILDASQGVSVDTSERPGNVSILDGGDAHMASGSSQPTGMTGDPNATAGPTGTASDGQVDAEKGVAASSQATALSSDLSETKVALSDNPPPIMELPSPQKVGDQKVGIILALNEQLFKYA